MLRARLIPLAPLLGTGMGSCCIRPLALPAVATVGVTTAGAGA